MTQLRWQTHLGFTKEIGWGNSTSVPSLYVPVQNPKFKDTPKFYLDEAYRSIQAKIFGAYQATLQGDGEFETDVYVDTFPVLAGACMVGNTDTVVNIASASVFAPVVAGVAATVSQHTFLLGAPSSISLFDYNGYTERVYQGSRFSDVSIKYSPDGELKATYKANGRLSVANASSANVLTPVIGGTPPLMGWQGYLLLNGVQSTRLIEATIEMKRGIEVLFTQAQTQSPTNIYAFPLEVTGKFTFDFVDELEYNFFRTNQQSASFDMTFAASAQDAVRFVIPQPVFTMYEVDRSKDFVQCQISFEGIYSQANSTNMKLIVYTTTSTPF